VCVGSAVSLQMIGLNDGWPFPIVTIGNTVVAVMHLCKSLTYTLTCIFRHDSVA
jgi:hypothetical protein